MSDDFFCVTISSNAFCKVFKPLVSKTLLILSKYFDTKPLLSELYPKASPNMAFEANRNDDIIFAFVSSTTKTSLVSPPISIVSTLD